MADEDTAPLAAAIRDHLDLRRRNAGLEYEMPLANYIEENPLLISDEPSRGDLALDEEITEEVTMSNRWPVAEPEPAPVITGEIASSGWPDLPFA